MSKLNIFKLEIENFRSIQSKVTLDIRPGLFSIEGQNMDENTLNGAGKTTLVSAMYWCLTGNALTNEVLADDVINTKVGNNCKVSVYIESSQGEIKITRTRKDKEFGNNLILEIAGQNVSCHKVNDTQQRLNQIIKIPFDLLHSTIIMTSDMKSAFSDLTPQQRIQTLESIRDYSLWDKVRDEANKDIKVYNKDIQEIKLALSNLNGQLSTYISLRDKTITQCEQQNSLFDKDEIKNKIISLEKLIISNNTCITEKTLELNASRTALTVDTSDKETLCRNIMDEANKIKLSIQALEYDIKTSNAEILILDKWFNDSNCPTCNKPLDRLPAEITEKEAARIRLFKQKEEKNKEIADLNIKIQAKRSEWASINTEIQAASKDRSVVTTQITSLEKDISNLTTEIGMYNKKISEYSNAESVFIEKINNLNKDIQEYKIKITDLEKDILTAENNLGTLENKRQVSDYFFKLLGSKGELRPYLLNKDIIYLNSCVQRYVNKFFHNTTVELKLNGHTIDILIKSSGIPKTVASLSGGEKKRLNFIIQLALYDLLKTTSQVGFNVLWLDEVESQLDPIGCQQLIDVIEDKSSEIESVFWITNNVTVSGALENKIICKKALGKTEVIIK